MPCESCGCDLLTSYGSGRFCGVKCARGFSTKSKRSEINDRVRQTLTGRGATRCCINCGKSYKANAASKTTYCSRTCHTSSPAWKHKLSEARLKAVQEGRVGSHAKKQLFTFEGKHIVCDSKLEYACLLWLTQQHRVTDIERCTEAIPYEMDGTHWYLPDFIVKTDHLTLIVEAKSTYLPSSMSVRAGWYVRSQEPKKKALLQFAESRGLEPFWFTLQEHRSFYNATRLHLNSKP